MSNDFIKLGLAVLEIESQAVSNLANNIGEEFSKACQYLLDCGGRIVVIGMGKSGHIANKIAATFASTGSPAFFVHPGEASHGDLGMITPQDVVVALSNSGETEEILLIFPLIKRLGVPLITLTGNPKSTLAKMASVNLDVSVDKEACPLGLAPTASTTAALAMGDALAIAILEARGFTSKDFALSHPSGTLGRRLLLRVDEIMHTNEELPTVSEETLVVDAIVEMTQKGFGMTSVVDQDNKVIGLYTDGDLRRTLDQGLAIHETKVKEVMTTGCKKIPMGTLAIDALQLMESNKITSLLIVNDNDQLLGLVHMHDLLRAKVV